jgi:hypothetical protein
MGEWLDVVSVVLHTTICLTVATVETGVCRAYPIPMPRHRKGADAVCRDESTHRHRLRRHSRQRQSHAAQHRLAAAQRLRRARRHCARLRRRGGGGRGAQRSCTSVLACRRTAVEIGPTYCDGHVAGVRNLAGTEHIGRLYREVAGCIIEDGCWYASSRLPIRV